METSFDSLAILITVGILLAILVCFILFLVALQNTLREIEPENRTMEPGKVWLLLIPVFSYVWLFIVVKAVSDSLKLQLEKYGIYSTERPTYNIGLAMCICVVCCVVPVVKGFASLAVLVCWIVYWVKVVEKKKELQTLRQTYANNNNEASIFSPSDLL